jgi:hypothetical protein
MMQSNISTYQQNNLQTLCCCGVPGPSGCAEGGIVCAGAGVWCVGGMCVCCVGPCVRQGAMRTAYQVRLPAQPMGPLCLQQDRERQAPQMCGGCCAECVHAGTKCV